MGLLENAIVADDFNILNSEGLRYPRRVRSPQSARRPRRPRAPRPSNHRPFATAQGRSRAAPHAHRQGAQDRSARLVPAEARPRLTSGAKKSSAFRSGHRPTKFWLRASPKIHPVAGADDLRRAVLRLVAMPSAWPRRVPHRSHLARPARSEFGTQLYPTDLCRGRGVRAAATCFWLISCATQVRALVPRCPESGVCDSGTICDPGTNLCVLDTGAPCNEPGLEQPCSRDVGACAGRALVQERRVDRVLGDHAVARDLQRQRRRL